MDSISPLKRRSQRGMIDFIQNKECQWLVCTFRVYPTNRTLHSQSESIKHIFQTIKWTVGYMKNEFNDGKNLVFLPFLGGEVDTEVATHVHALLEKPSQLTEDFERKTKDKMNELAQRAFEDGQMKFNYKKGWYQSRITIQDIPQPIPKVIHNLAKAH